MPGGGNPPGGGGGGRPPATPWMGAALKPMGAAPPPAKGCATIPRPAPRAMPGPPGVNFPAFVEGGGPSTARDTTFSPRINTSPSDRFSVRSSKRAAPPLDLSMRNSSASERTKFKCLSKAKNVPIMYRPSWSVTRNRCSTYLSNLLPFPLGCGAKQYEIH